MSRPSHEKETPPPALDAHHSHPRQFRGSRIIYPVLSRRSGGISVGVNLNLDKSCNFNCLYCQVETGSPMQESPASLNLSHLENELTSCLEYIRTGRIYEYDPFRQVPQPLRKLNDIALSGDGEPTAAAEFLAACRICVRVKEKLGLNDVKIVLITNASLLHLPEVQTALGLLDEHNGQIWAKLDAGTEAFFKLVNRCEVAFRQIKENLLTTSRLRPIIIQSLFFRLAGQRTPPEEIAAYAGCLAEIIDKGGQISAVQLYSIARPPRDKRVTSLTKDEIDQIAREITERINLPIEKYYPSEIT